MSSKKPTTKAAAATKEPKYIGVSIAEFLDETSRVAEAGKYQDGTTINPRVRDALSQFTKSLREPRLRIQYYVFVFSRHIFIVIDF